MGSGQWAVGTLPDLESSADELEERVESRDWRFADDERTSRRAPRGPMWLAFKDLISSSQNADLIHGHQSGAGTGWRTTAYPLESARLTPHAPVKFPGSFISRAFLPVGVRGPWLWRAGGTGPKKSATVFAAAVEEVKGGE